MGKDFDRWLKQPPRHLTFTDYCRLRKENRTLLDDAYLKFIEKRGKKIGRVEKRRKDKLNKYLEKLRKTT